MEVEYVHIIVVTLVKLPASISRIAGPFYMASVGSLWFPVNACFPLHSYIYSISIYITLYWDMP